MSQYPVPPSFDGQYNFAPPWPVHVGHDPSDPNHPGANFYAMNNANFTGIPFGSAAPFQLPVLGMAPNATFMPYQTQQFRYDEAPTPFYGVFNGPFDGSNEPVHSTQENTTAKPAKKKRKSLPSRRPSKSPKHPPRVSNNEADREEGEVSDGSGHDPSRHRSQRKLNTGKITPASLEASLSRSQSALGTDTSLSRSQTPPRNNGTSSLMLANVSPRG